MICFQDFDHDHGHGRSDLFVPEPVDAANIDTMKHRETTTKSSSERKRFFIDCTPYDDKPNHSEELDQDDSVSSIAHVLCFQNG